MDAIIALFVIVILIIIAYPYIKSTTQKTQIHYDIITSLSTIKIGELDNAYVKSLIQQGIINDTNKTLIEQIGEFYVTDLTLAKNLANEFLKDVKTNQNLGIWYENTLIASLNSSSIESAKNIETARQIISGIKEGQSVTGFSARAYLINTLKKEYYYFGGYIGDGNITIRIEYNGTINSSEMELAINNDFKAYVNGFLAGNYQKSDSEFIPKKYTIPVANFNSGINLIELKGENLHIAGGFIKIEYKTIPVYQQPTKYYLPGLEGLINIYDGFYIPNNLTNMSIYLHFKTNKTIFLTIGSKTLFESSNLQQGIEQTITLNNTYLESKLNYLELKQKTTPIRLGTKNVTNTSILDIVIVNDRSWSMRQSGWTLNTSIQPNPTFNDVNVPKNSYSQSFSFNVPQNTERIAIAITWDKEPNYNGSEGSEFALNIRRPSGSWIFGTGKPNNASGKVDPPDNAGANNEYFSGISTKPQIAYIENPQQGNWEVKVYGWNLRPKTSPPPSQKVNISIYQGNSTEIIKNPTILSNEASINASKRFIDEMPVTDRAAYVKFGSYALLSRPLTFNKNALKTAISNTGLEGGTAIQTGIESARNELTNARQNATKIVILMTDGQNDAGPAPATQAAQLAKNQGIIIFTIGLTEFANKEMLQQIASVPQYFYYTQDASGLENIYAQISEAITAIYREQTLTSSDNALTNYLYPDSYIEFNYQKNSFPYGIIITTEKQFDNKTSGTLSIPIDLLTANIKAISYSGPRWTDKLEINNNEIYNINNYGETYTKLGDPHVIEIPTQFIQQNNAITLTTATSPLNSSEGSEYNKIISTFIKNFSAYTKISPLIQGCVWTIEFEDSTNITIILPRTSSTPSCFYTSSQQSHDDNDATQSAVNNLLKTLDIDNNNKVNIKLTENDLNIDINQITGIPYTWSTEVQVRTWN